MSVVDDLEQIATLVAGQRSQSPVVQDQQLDARQALEEPRVSPISACQRQRLEHPRHTMVEDGTVVAACLVAQCACDPALADTGGAGDEQVLLACDPVAIDELGEEAALDAARRAQIDILDDRSLAQGGELQARDEP